MVETIGAELIESIEYARMATHVIPSDGVVKMRRTAKLMVCLSTTSNILSIEWLVQSSSQRRILDTEDFLLIGNNRDIEAELRYKFSMADTIQNSLLARENNGGVLGGWSVYICDGVAGNNFPGLKELRLIIEAAGGSVLQESLPNLHLDNIVLLTSDWTSVPDGMEGVKICTPTDFLRVITTQNPYEIGTCMFYTLRYSCHIIPVTLISSTQLHSNFLIYYRCCICGRTGGR